MNNRVLIFDFDGVIVLGSQMSKHRAWSNLFANKGQQAIDIVKSTVAKFSNGRGSRYDILAEVYTHFGDITLDKEQFIADYAEQYDQMVRQAILTEGVRPDDRHALTVLSESMPLYVNTFTPQKTIDQTLRQLNLESIFKKVYGAPIKKIEALKAIADDEGAQPHELTFIGDGEGDREAAEIFGCQFIGLANNDNQWFQRKPGFLLIKSIAELSQII